MDLLVKDILDRPYFKNAEVVAGQKGLDRSIKWVHIVEIETFGHLLNGQEMILTTGIGWIHDEQKCLHYLQQLIDHDVSVLCIELNQKVEQLPDAMITLAEKHQFPIILFKEEVKFIDITRDIHQLLLKYEENTWWKLEHLYKDMHQNLIQNGSIVQFLKILHQGINKSVALIDQDQHVWAYPPASMKLTEDLEQLEVYLSVPIYLLDDIIAHLYILDHDQSTFDQLAINRCSELLSQYFWKYHQQIEIQEVKKNEWLLNAVFDQLSTDGILKYMRQDQGINLKEIEAVVSVLPIMKQSASPKANHTFLTGALMSLRMAIEQENCHLFVTKNEHFYIFLFVNQQDTYLLNKLKNALTSLKQKDTHSLMVDQLAYLSFGKVINDLKDIATSYQTALATLDYQQHINLLNEPFYQSLGLYRLLRMKEQSELQDIVNDYIGPIVQYDLEKGTELVKTLKVFLENLGAKNQTAEDLFIVRQTLYHRLDRIESLIGHDFMSAEKRMMIEIAIYALDFLESRK